MAYEKQTWTTGEVITQEKLNHMEQGIEDAYELPTVTETDNGKVLGVENGQFGLVSGGGGDGLKNLVDGSATGSVRGVGTIEEDSSYTMGQHAFAEGFRTEASGDASHAEGYGTHATHRAQHVVGMYNEIDPSQADSSMSGEYLEMVGNGSSDNNRSNARTLDWNGNETLQGHLTLGKGSADETTVTAAQLKALIALLNA